MNIRLCLNTALISAPLPEKIRLASEAGYSAIETSLPEIESCGVRETYKALNDHGMSVASVGGLSGWEEDDGGPMGVSDSRKAIMDECRRRMEVAAAVGSPFITARPKASQRNKWGNWWSGVRRYQELLSLGRVIGCLPTIEYDDGTDMHSVEKCLDFLFETNDGDCTMVVDAYRLWRGFGSLDDAAMIPAGMVSVIRAGDANPLVCRDLHAENDKILPGDGCINFTRFFQTCFTAGHLGYISVDICNPLFRNDEPDKLVKASFRKMAEILRRCF